VATWRVMPAMMSIRWHGLSRRARSVDLIFSTLPRIFCAGAMRDCPLLHASGETYLDCKNGLS
jgi:hypothetical protein